MSEYNYASFDFAADQVNHFEFPKLLAAGGRAPDATLSDLSTGESIRLSDLWRTGPVVAEFGSFT